MTSPLWRHLFLAPVIAAAPYPAVATDYLSVTEAQRMLVPRAQSFVPYKVVLDAGQLKRIKAIAGVPQRTATPKIWKAMAGPRQLGWVLVDEVIGKHEYITYATAISPEGNVLGMEILTYRESKGGQVRGPKWRALFRGKNVNDQFKLNKDIPNISGATLSCRNLTDGVKRLLAIHEVALLHA